MKQLKMYWLPGSPVQEFPLPEGYAIRNYGKPGDAQAWCDCCLHGRLVNDGDPMASWKSAIEGRGPDLVPERDVFFLTHNGDPVGTVTAYVHSEDNTGDMHMVGIREDHRGLGLSKYLSAVTLQKFTSDGVAYGHLTTDDFRPAAVKGYLNAGFLPVDYDGDMQQRWSDMLELLHIDSVQMLNDDATPLKVLYRTGLQK